MDEKSVAVDISTLPSVEDLTARHLRSLVDARKTAEATHHEKFMEIVPHLLLKAVLSDANFKAIAGYSSVTSIFNAARIVKIFSLSLRWIPNSKLLEDLGGETQIFFFYAEECSKIVDFLKKSLEEKGFTCEVSMNSHPILTAPPALEKCLGTCTEMTAKLSW